MSARTHAGIVLGPPWNIQGLQKVFDIKTGVVVKRRKTTKMPMSDQVLNHMNEWGKKLKCEEYGIKLKFPNRTKQRYDWDNDDLDDDESIVEEDPAHPDLPTKIPGVDLESEYMDPRLAIQE